MPPATFTDLDSDLREHHVSDKFAINVSEVLRDIETEHQETVDRLWQGALASTDNNLFDGTILSVSQITETAIIVQHSSYRYFYAQQAVPSLFNVLNVRPLACSGVLHCKDGLVIARRAPDVFLDPGYWELAPSGTMDSEAVDARGNVDFSSFLLRELQEELSIEPKEAHVRGVVGLYEHLHAHGIDIAMEIETKLSATEVRNRFSAKENPEYDAIDIVPAHQMDAFIRNLSGQCVGLTTILVKSLSKA